MTTFTEKFTAAESRIFTPGIETRGTCAENGAKHAGSAAKRVLFCQGRCIRL